jgi:hypothetical protein
MSKIEIELDDVKTMIAIIQICFERNSFQIEEIEKVHNLNDKLISLLKIPKLNLDNIKLNLDSELILPINPDNNPDNPDNNPDNPDNNPDNVLDITYEGDYVFSELIEKNEYFFDDSNLIQKESNLLEDESNLLEDESNLLEDENMPILDNNIKFYPLPTIKELEEEYEKEVRNNKIHKNILHSVLE